MKRKYIYLYNFICFRVFKKVSPNQKLTLYLSSRDLVVSPEGIDRITGVLLVDPEFVEERKVYGQVTLTFRQVHAVVIIILKHCFTDNCT